MSQPRRASRRSYFKYIGAGVVVVAGAVSGAYYFTRPLEIMRTSVTTYISPTPKPVTSMATRAFTLQSDDFGDDGEIPPNCTCDGENLSPHFSWENAPGGTSSFALSVVDIDAPGRTFVHWLVYDIPSHVREIERGSLPEGAQQVENDFGKKEYGGPCPPSGTHRYVFTLYALDVEYLDAINKNSFFETIEKHTIGKAELTGLYTRR